MPEIVRAALVQQAWTGDKDSMTAAAVAHIATAASAGAQVVCLQELFYGPYFCQVQDADYYSYTEAIPDGPTTRLMQDVARQRGIVIVVPMYEEEQPGLYYNTAAVIDADGSYLGQVPEEPHPPGQGILGEVLLPAGQSRLPHVRHRGRPDRRLHLLRPALPRRAGGRSGWRARGSCSTRPRPARGPVLLPVELEQPAAAVANEYYIGAINRVGVEPLGDNDFYGQSYFVDPRGQLVGDAAADNADEVIVRDLDMDRLAEVRDLWQFYRDRRPDSYESLVETMSLLIKGGTVVTAEGTRPPTCSSRARRSRPSSPGRRHGA